MSEKTEKKKSISKKEFNFEALRDKFSTKDKYKPTEYLDLGKEFHKASGMMIPLGATTQVIGWSNTGKSTIMTLAAVDAQRKGILPIFIITEQKFSFEHARQMGLKCELKRNDADEEYWDGFLLYKLGFEYVEQIFEYINEVLDAQKKGEIPYDILFLWDSIGSIPCKMTYDGKGGTQHTARTIADKWGMGIAQRITSSNKESSPHRNTAIIVNQPWFELPDNPLGQGRIQPKGGQAIYLSSSLVILCGNQKSSGTSQISLGYKNRKVNFGIRTKITVMKNHINGLGYADSRIIAVPHGFIEDTPESIKEYKNANSKYWSDILNIENGSIDDIEFIEEEINSKLDFEG